MFTESYVVNQDGAVWYQVSFFGFPTMVLDMHYNLCYISLDFPNPHC